MRQRLHDWLYAKFTTSDPDVGRAFIACGAGSHAGCNRIIPYYRVYGRNTKNLGCPSCGNTYVRPVNIPEWQAALRLLWGWLTMQGDPRITIRRVPNRYA